MVRINHKIGKDVNITKIFKVKKNKFVTQRMEWDVTYELWQDGKYKVSHKSTSKWVTISN